MIIPRRPHFPRRFCIVNAVTGNGRLMTTQVRILQAFRENYLERSAIGRWFVDRYYALGDLSFVAWKALA
jgi:hypothetical protein